MPPAIIKGRETILIGRNSAVPFLISMKPTGIYLYATATASSVFMFSVTDTTAKSPLCLGYRNNCDAVSLHPFSENRRCSRYCTQVFLPPCR